MRAVAQEKADEVSLVQHSVRAVYGLSSIILVCDCAITGFLFRWNWSAVAACAVLGLSYLHMQAQVNIERGLWLGALSFKRAIAIEIIATGTRLIGLGIVLSFGSKNLLGISLGIGLSALLTLALVRCCLAYPPMLVAADRSWWQAAREGAPFALTAFSWNTFAELPKFALALVMGSTAVGHFSAAFRVLSIAYLPLQSALNALTPRVFAATTARGPGTLPLARALAETLTLGSGFAAALMLGAPLLAVVLGSEYAPATPLLRVLALSLPLQALAFISGDWLGGMGQQKYRFGITAATVLLAVPFSLMAARQAGTLGTAVIYSAMTGLLALASVVVARRTATPR